jgi:hypothetical protein
MFGEIEPSGSSRRISMRESAEDGGEKNGDENFLEKRVTPAAATEWRRNSRRGGMSG